MRERVAGGLATGAAAAAAALALAWWISLAPAASIGPRVPLDHPGHGGSGAAGPVDLSGRYQAFGGTPSAIQARWPGFRGPGRDNVSPETAPLAETWPAGGPPVLWSADLGEGHAGPAVAFGRVYLLDYDEAENADALRCLSLDDGAEIWRRSYAVRVKRNHGMSRTVPAVNERVVVSVGPRCHVLCVDAISGDFLWGIDLFADYGATEPLWYTGQCPLLDGDTAVLAPAGTALLLGVNAADGTVLWQTPNPRGWKMSHASVMVATLCGRRVYVYAALGGIALVAAEGPDRGRLLAETAAWSPSVQAPSPVALPGDRLLVTAGYGGGSAVLRVSDSGGRLGFEVAARIDRSVFACEQHTPVLHGDRLYAVLPKDAGPSRQRLVCADLSLAPVWTSGKADRFGLGPFLIADGKVLVLEDTGVLTLARAGGDAFVRLAQARVLEGRDAWAPMAIVEGRLLLRDWKRMICLDLRREPGGG